MTEARKNKIVSSTIQKYLGKPCPCCQQRNDFEADFVDPEGTWESLRIFQRVFNMAVIKPGAVIAFRIVPIQKAIAKRGEEFFWQEENLFAACTMQCKLAYERMWERHPKRVRFLERLEKGEAPHLELLVE